MDSFRLPWDQETLFGYICEIVLSLVCIEAYLLFNGALLLLFISMCLHHRTFNKMFQYSLQKLDHDDNQRNDRLFICKQIRFHISVKEYETLAEQ